MTEIRTGDIFRSAFLLSSGGMLNETKLTKHDQVVFVIRGKELDKLDINYRTGQALVEPLKMRETLNLLRDLISEKLRGNTRRRIYE